MGVLEMDLGPEVPMGSPTSATNSRCGVWVVHMAGKAKRLDQRKRRRAKKVARKMARKAQYELWKKEGRNTKSKRVKLRAARLRKKTIQTLRHRDGPCGNFGCKRCNPIPENLMNPIQFHQVQ